MSKITKKELVDGMAAATGQTKEQSTKALDALLELTSNHLAAGCEVSLGGIGTLAPASRSARTGRNPRTGESVEIAASTTVKFKASSTLKNALN